MDNKGYSKGELCNRNGCNGIIEEPPKEGCCTCHINPPCSYCTTQTAYCPECGWSAEDEENAYLEKHAKAQTPFVYHYKTDQQLFDELKDGEFGYVRLDSGRSFIRLKGKHPGMTNKEIFEKLNVYENPNMPRMKYKDANVFELTYFCD